jgi:hypothetical protein
MPDKNKYVYFGGLHKDMVISEESEIELKEIETREKEEMEKQSLYYRQDYLRMKKANSADFIYIYDPGKSRITQSRTTGGVSDVEGNFRQTGFFIKASTEV